MSHPVTRNPSPHVYRVDKFVVPPAARDELLARVRDTHALLRTLPGYVHDAILEQTDGPGEFNLVTIVEWESADAVANARPLVMSMHHRTGFDAKELMQRLHIRADMASYQQAAP